MSLLGPEPARFAPLPRTFFRALAALLDALAPPWLDAAMTKASPRDDGIEVVLAHGREVSFTVWIQAQRDVIVVGCASLHEEHADPAAALALVAALLCGERDVRGYDGATLRPDFGARRPAAA